MRPDKLAWGASGNRRRARHLTKIIWIYLLPQGFSAIHSAPNLELSYLEAIYSAQPCCCYSGMPQLLFQIIKKIAIDDKECVPLPHLRYRYLIPTSLSQSISQSSLK
jgi:hypothetical protein